MKSVITAASFGFAVFFGLDVQSAAAESLSRLESACRTGDYAACSRHNAAVIALNSSESEVLTEGYDPFKIVPASLVERTPTGAVDIESAGETNDTASVIPVSQ